jgi:hypothetical protein
MIKLFKKDSCDHLFLFRQSVIKKPASIEGMQAFRQGTNGADKIFSGIIVNNPDSGHTIPAPHPVVIAERGR